MADSQRARETMAATWKRVTSSSLPRTVDHKKSRRIMMRWQDTNKPESVASRCPLQMTSRGNHTVLFLLARARTELRKRGASQLGCLPKIESIGRCRMEWTEQRAHYPTVTTKWLCAHFGHTCVSLKVQARDKYTQLAVPVVCRQVDCASNHTMMLIILQMEWLQTNCD